MYHAVPSSSDDGHKDASLKSRHHCTDIPCCFLFSLSLLAFAGLCSWIVVQTKGSPERLFNGINSDGLVCGADPFVVNKTLLFWCASAGSKNSSSFAGLALGRRVCVSECPGSVTDQVRACAAEDALGGEILSMGAYPTTRVLGRYCVPSVKEYGDAAKTALGSQLGDGWDERVAEALQALPSAWPALLAALVLAIALGYLFLFLLRCCAVVLIWTNVVCCIVGLGALGAYLWLTAGSEIMVEELPKNLRPSKPELSDDEETYVRAAAVVCWGLAIVALCVACCLRHSIDAAAACLEVASEVIFEMPSLLLAPAVKAVCKGTLFAGLLYGGLLLYSLGQAADYDLPLRSAMVHHLNGTLASAGLEVPHLEHSQLQCCLLCFFMLMSFWVLAFASALYEFVVAYTVATYYYTPHEHDEDGHTTDQKDVEGCCAALEGLHVGLFSHMGSLAMGSFLIAVLRCIQKVIEYAQLKDKEAGDNGVVKAVLCICGVCIACLKNVVGFVNKNAYIDMAITSNSFCAAARRALQMILEIGGAMAILNGATFVFAFFGVLFITSTCAAGVYVAADFRPFNDPSSAFFVEDAVAAAVVAAAVGFLVALAFMDILDMASDTLLYCYGGDVQSGKDNHAAPHALQLLLYSHSDDHSDEDRGHTK